MKYLLDFDRTVFDMESLYESIAQTNPQTELGTIASLDGLPLETFLFPDALQFFASHDPSDIEIISSCYGKTGQWDLDYQKEKIRLSNVADFVGQVHVVAEDKVSCIEKITGRKPAVFVDDHPEHIRQVAEALPTVTAVYIDRLQERSDAGNVKRIESLTELDASIFI